MSAATQAQVFHYYRLLTREEARNKQLLLVVCLALPLSALYLVFKPFSLALTVTLVGYFLNDSIELFVPNNIYTSRLLTYDKESAAYDKTSGVKDSNNKQPERPIYADKFEPLSYRIKKIFFSDTVVMLMRATAALAVAYFFSKFIYDKFSAVSLFIVLFTLYIISLYVAFTSLIEYIENRDIDEFPHDRSDKIMLSISRTFSYARGAYFIGEVEGKRIGLRRSSRFMHMIMIRCSKNIIPG